MPHKKNLPFRKRTFQGIRTQNKIQSCLLKGISLEYQLKENSKILGLQESAYHHFVCAWEYNKDRIIYTDNFPEQYYRAAFKLFSSDEVEVIIQGNSYKFTLGSSDIFGNGLLEDLIHKKNRGDFYGEKLKLSFKLLTPPEGRELLRDSSGLSFYEDNLSDFKEHLLRKVKTMVMTPHLFCERLKMFSLDVDPENVIKKIDKVEEKLKSLPLKTDLLDVGQLFLLKKMSLEKIYNQELVEKVKTTFETQLKAQYDFLEELSTDNS